MEIQQSHQQFYNEQYTEDIVEWRELGAIQKANNIIEFTKNKKINHLLDVGAGEGSILKILSTNNVSNQYSALEISQSGIEKIKDKKIEGLINLIKFNGYNIPLLINLLI